MSSDLFLRDIGDQLDIADQDPADATNIKHLLWSLVGVRCEEPGCVR